MLKTFKEEGVVSTEKLVIPVFVTSTFIFLILIVILCLGILYSKRSSKEHCLRRQNVFTLNSTLFWGLIHCGLFISLSSTLYVENILIHSVLRFLIIFFDFIKSVLTIFENQKNFPELFSDMEMRNLSPNFISLADIDRPRQEILMPSLPFQQNAR